MEDHPFPFSEFDTNSGFGVFSVTDSYNRPSLQQQQQQQQHTPAGSTTPPSSLQQAKQQVSPPNSTTSTAPTKHHNTRSVSFDTPLAFGMPRGGGGGGGEDKHAHTLRGTDDASGMEEGGDKDGSHGTTPNTTSDTSQFFEPQSGRPRSTSEGHVTFRFLSPDSSMGLQPAHSLCNLRHTTTATLTDLGNTTSPHTGSLLYGGNLIEEDEDFMFADVIEHRKRRNTEGDLLPPPTFLSSGFGSSSQSSPSSLHSLSTGSPFFSPLSVSGNGPHPTMQPGATPSHSLFLSETKSVFFLFL